MWWVPINVYILPLMGNFFLTHQDPVNILFICETFLTPPCTPSQNLTKYIIFKSIVTLMHWSYSMVILHYISVIPKGSELLVRCYIFVIFKNLALTQDLTHTKSSVNTCWWVDKWKTGFPVSRRSGEKPLLSQNTFGTWQGIPEILLMKSHPQTWISPFKQERLKGLCHGGR